MQDGHVTMGFIGFFVLANLIHTGTCQKTLFNVLDYGATGNGQENDTEAFIKAWKDTCNSVVDNPTMLIPDGKIFLLNPIDFKGPCKSEKINIKLNGLIKAPDDPDTWKNLDASKWLKFKGVSGLKIDGCGSLDGLGNGWWAISCKWNPGEGCNKLAPTVLSFESCNGIQLSNITVINSPQTHILLLGCKNVNLNLLNIESPEDSPNTDGIHISDSANIFVYNSSIKNGDDCISIGDHVSYLNISDINCADGHGVSIGSLGRGGSTVDVANIKVSNVKFTGTTDGARIKTWQEGKGQVRNITFSNLNFSNVSNPIIIDQHYCEVHDACLKTDTGVHIDDVQYIGAFGTSSTKMAVNFNCSDNVPCTNIKLQNIKLTSITGEEKVTSSCNNAHGEALGSNIEPSCCLQK